MIFFEKWTVRYVRQFTDCANETRIHHHAPNQSATSQARHRQRMCCRALLIRGQGNASKLKGWQNKLSRVNVLQNPPAAYGRLFCVTA